MSKPIPFIDLGAQRRRLGASVDDAIMRVVNHGGYIMGPEVFALEADLAAFCGAKHVISCANGTDALALVLMAKDVRPGRCDPVPELHLRRHRRGRRLARRDAGLRRCARRHLQHGHRRAWKRASRTARENGLRPVGVIPVDLFGQPADYDAIEPFCEREGLWILVATPPRALARPTRAARSAPSATCHHDELLPGQAARLLRRRRRRSSPTDDAARRGAALPARPRPGHGQIRQCPHRHERPARHDAGGGADREAEDLRRRDRRARPHRAALQRGPGDVAIVPE